MATVYWSATSNHDRFPASGSATEGSVTVSATFPSGLTIPVPGISPSPRMQDFWYASGQYQMNLINATNSSLPSGHTVTLKRSGATDIVLTSTGVASAGSAPSLTWRWTSSRISGGSGDYTLEFARPDTFEFDPATATANLVNNQSGTISLGTYQANMIAGAGLNTYRLVGTVQQGISVVSTTGLIRYQANAANNAALPAVGESFTVTMVARNDNGDTINRFVLTVTVDDDLVPSFGSANIQGQTYTVGQAITNISLPEGTGGNPPLTYSIRPTLPAGLSITNRVLSGTPTASQAQTTYRWRVHDVDGDRDVIRFTITINASSALENARAVWREPRVWEGQASDGENADQLGEWDTDNLYGQKIAYSPNMNRYDLTYEISEPLQRTMPAVASARGQLLIGSGTNQLTTLAIGTGGELTVESGTPAYETGGDALAEGYPTDAKGEIVVGDADGDPATLSPPANDNATYILVANGVGETPSWHKLEAGIMPYGET